MRFFIIFILGQIQPGVDIIRLKVTRYENVIFPDINKSKSMYYYITCRYGLFLTPQKEKILLLRLRQRKNSLKFFPLLHLVLYIILA